MTQSFGPFPSSPPSLCLPSLRALVRTKKHVIKVLKLYGLILLLTERTVLYTDKASSIETSPLAVSECVGTLHYMLTLLAN